MKLRKKIAGTLLCCAILATGAVGLVGCGDGHTHAYEGTVEYGIKEVNGEKKAYTYVACDCGEEGNVTMLDENKYIIVSADESADNYAQKILDGNINGKIIVFDEGTYGNLEVRPTLATATVYNTLISEGDYTTKGEAVSAGEDLVAKRTYFYDRSLSNITFAGTRGAKFEGIFDIESRTVTANSTSSPLQNRYDAVKGFALSDSTWWAYLSYMDIDGLTFDGMNFSGSMGRIFIYNTNPNPKLDNIKVQNCKFSTTEIATGSGNGGSFGASVYINGTGQTINNLKYLNNNSVGHYQGIYTTNVKNAEFVGNVIKNTTHNAIAIQSTDGGSVSGTVLIKNNTISDATDRAIRFNLTGNATIQVLNNSFSNCTEDGSLLKTGLASAGANSTYAFTGNTYGGNVIQDASGIITDSVYWEVTVA